MPQPPAGESALRDLAQRFAEAEGQVIGGLTEAATGNRKAAAKRALATITALRKLDTRGPVIAAYQAEHTDGHPDAVRDLAGSLAQRLDSAAYQATWAARDVYSRVTVNDDLAEMARLAVIAHRDDRGTRWSLAAWAAMNTTTIGRRATTRGLEHNVGEGGVVIVHTGECGYCAKHAGPAVVGTSPLPPFHPSCSCVASRA